VFFRKKSLCVFFQNGVKKIWRKKTPKFLKEFLCSGNRINSLRSLGLSGSFTTKADHEIMVMHFYGSILWCKDKDVAQNKNSFDFSRSFFVDNSLEISNIFTPRDFELTMMSTYFILSNLN